jgi:hypothetical protein
MRVSTIGHGTVAAQDEEAIADETQSPRREPSRETRRARFDLDGGTGQQDGSGTPSIARR